MILDPRPGLLVACAAAALGAQESAPPIAPIDAARFDELRDLLTPDANAPWRSIPWQIRLLDAQRTAAAQDRPLFIWAMDGHPLGCT